MNRKTKEQIFKVYDNKVLIIIVFIIHIFLYKGFFLIIQEEKCVENG